MGSGSVDARDGLARHDGVRELDRPCPFFRMVAKPGCHQEYAVNLAGEDRSKRCGWFFINAPQFSERGLPVRILEWCRYGCQYVSLLYQKPQACACVPLDRINEGMPLAYLSKELQPIMEPR